MSRTLLNSTTVVGRAPELALARQVLQRAEQGRGGVLLLAGEAGIGKSRLAQEIADIARRLGFPVYMGFAWEAGGAPAYWPWIQVLRAAVNAAAQSHGLPPALAQLLPDSEPVSGSGEQLDPESARFRQLEAVRELLAGLGAVTPLLLVLEDLHAADRDSLVLLQYVSRHIPGMRLVIVATFRELEARNSEHTRPLLQTTRDAQLIRLTHFGRTEVMEFVKAKTGRSPAPQSVDRLLALTEGNPLFLNELVALHESGLDLEIPRLPANLQQVIEQQLERLPESALATLRTASVLGREFSTCELGELAGLEAEQLRGQIDAALGLGVLEARDTDSWRFCHVLYLEVLRQGLPPARLALLHARRAALLRQWLDTTGADRWRELALHLNAAGPAHRSDAVAAWREAAARSRQRLAFDQAAQDLQCSLEAASDDPRFDSLARGQLLLELAEANLTRGEVDRGRSQCQDVFRLARELRMVPLMIEAALTYGTVIVVAQVDGNLVDMLEQCLPLLSEEDIALRARVAARLAGALQPAPDPAEPVRMAREAIAMARTTGDDRVVHAVLKSATSALMDFAPAWERVPLNRELAQLSSGFGDVPGEFRGYLRLLIDGCELGDRALVDNAASDCARIAERLSLPHYEWRMRSLRALQATLDGDYPRAMEFLGQAETLAGTVDDQGALLTLPLQRLCILLQWEGPGAPERAELERQLTQALTLFPEAECYVRPVTSYLAYLDGEQHYDVLCAGPELERIVAGGDRCSLCLTGCLAAHVGNARLARRCFDALLPFAEDCATMGLMGSAWFSPVAYALGVIAQSLGDEVQARTFLQQSLEIALRMRAGPMVSRSHAALAELYRQTDDTGEMRRHAGAARRTAQRMGLRPWPGAAAAGDSARPAPASSAPRLHREGEFWRIGYGDREILVKASRGLTLLAALLARPNEPVHVLELAAGGSTPGPPDAGDSGPLLDDQARREYRERLLQLQEAIEEARDRDDLGMLDALQEERDLLARELSRAFGLGGGPAPAGRLPSGPGSMCRGGCGMP